MEAIALLGLMCFVVTVVSYLPLHLLLRHRPRIVGLDTYQVADGITIGTIYYVYEKQLWVSNNPHPVSTKGEWRQALKWHVKENGVEPLTTRKGLKHKDDCTYAVVIPRESKHHHSKYNTLPQIAAQTLKTRKGTLYVLRAYHEVQVYKEVALILNNAIKEGAERLNVLRQDVTL